MQGISFNLKTKVDSISKNKNGVTINTTDEQGIKKQFDCDVVLISVGRKPNTSNLNLEKVGVDKDNKGRVKVNKHFQTNIKNVYAIGDVTPVSYTHLTLPTTGSV